MITVNNKADFEWAVDDLTEYIRAGGRAFDWLRAAKLAPHVAYRSDDGTPDGVNFNGLNWWISLRGVRAEAIAFERFVEQLPVDVVQALRADAGDYLDWHDDGDWGFEAAWERAVVEKGDVPGDIEDIFYEYLHDDWEEAFDRDKSADRLSVEFMSSLRHRFHDAFDADDALGNYILDNDVDDAMLDAFLAQGHLGDVVDDLVRQYRDMSEGYWSLVEKEEE